MADEFKIVASLDVPKSVQEINKDIPKLQGQSKHLKIIADLDPKLSIKNIQATLNKMNNNANIKIGIDTSGLNSVQGATQNITAGLKNIQTQAQQTASAVTNSINQQATSIESTLNAVKNRWLELHKASNNGNINDFGLAIFERDLQAIVPLLEKDKQLLNDLYSNVGKFNSVNSLHELVSAISEIGSQYSTFKSVQDEVNKQFQTTISFETSSAKSTELLYERFRILTNQLLQYEGISKSISKLSQKDIANTITGSIGVSDNGVTKQTVSDFYNFLISNTNKAEAEILQLNQGLQQFNYLLNGLKAFNDSGSGLGIISRSTTLDLNTFSVYLEPMQKFLAGEKQAIAEAQEMDIAYKKLKQTLIETFGESAIFQNGNYTVTIEQLKAVVDKAPLAQKYIDDIESRFASLPSVSTQSTQVVNSNMAKVEEQSRETAVAIEQQTQAMEKLNNVQSSATAINSNTNNIANTSKLLESFKSSLANMNLPSEQIDSIASRISNLNVEITSLNQSMSVNKLGNRMLSVDISGTDKLGNAVKLTQRYNLETNELVRTIDTLSSATQKSSSQLDNLMAQQIKRKADLKNQVEQMYKAAIDPNASRSITNGQNLDTLKAKYDEIKLAIDGMDGKSKTAFAQQEADISKLISNLKVVINQYKNAENVSTTLKPDKLASAISKAESQFQVLNTNIQNAGVSSDKLTQNVQTISSVLGKTQNGGVINKAEIEQVFTALSNARNELEALIKMKTSDSAIERVRIQAETLVSSLNTFANNNVGFDKFTTTVNGAVISVDSLKQSLATVNSQSDLSIIRSQVTALETAFKETAVDSDKYVTQINSAITKLQGLANSPTFIKNASNPQVTQTKQDINSLITAYQNLMTKLQGNITPAGLETVRTELIELNARFNTTTATAQRFESELKNDNGAEKLAQKVALLKAQLEALAKSNPKALKKFGNEINSLMATLNSNPDATAVNRVAKSVQLLRREINNADLAGKTFFQNLKEKATKFTGWMSMTYAISLATRTIRSMITEVVNLDTALIDLKKTFKGTNSDLQDFYYEANNVAKQLGVTTEEVINTASSWSRLGYSTKEAAIAMSKYASMFKMISPDMSMEDSTDGLLSVMKAFDIEVNDVLDGIMSKINKVGNEFGTSNNEIVQMLMRSSSAMKEGNNTLAETIALETSAVEITRDYASVGTAYKTLAMRLRGYDEELETYSNDVQVLSGEIANLTKTAKKPSGVSLFKDDAKTEYKSTLEILRDIREVYDDLDDKTQAQLLEKIAGKRQGQIIAATLSNWDTVEEALVAMENADGSALNEMNTIMESISYRANIFKETLVGIAQGLFSQDFMKSMVDSGTRVLNVFDDLTPIISFLIEQISSLLELITKLADTIGGIPLLIAGIGLKNVGSPKMFGLV